MRLLTKGTIGLDVVNLQSELAKLGLLKQLDIDGDFGDRTLAAVLEFQRSHGLDDDGVVGGLTWAKLREPKEVTPVSTKELVNRSQAEYIFKNSITPEQLADLNKCLNTFGIISIDYIQHFLAQVAHESGGLKYAEELATGVAYEPHTEIGKELGNIHKGDGVRFKGGGFGQITGRYNYQRFSDSVGDTRVMEGSSYVARVYPFTSFGFWWDDNGINSLIDAGADCREVSARVNGTDPANKLEERLYYFDRARTVLSPPATLNSFVWTLENIKQGESIIPGGNFTWAEATRGGSRMPPNQEVLEGIIRIATLAQEARNLIGRPFIVTSWYRDPAANAMAGGVDDSRHLVGDAIDFYVNGMTGAEIYDLLDPRWSGGLGQYSRHPDICHIDARDYRARWTN